MAGSEIGIKKEAELTHKQEALSEELQEKHTELTRAISALRESNEELQRFAYIASHDLQAPLRSLAGFSEILYKDYGDVLDDAGKRYLHHIIGAARRMKRLVQGLLTYSRLDRHTSSKVVDLEKVLARAIEQLRDRESLDFILDYGNLPQVQGSEPLLLRVFLELLRNAVNHTEDSVVKVHVEAEVGQREVIISVRDDGPGIDVDHHQRVFEIFRRLKPDDQSESVGIGLTVCRRVIQHHGGRIWIESNEGAGTTVKFTLTKAP